MPSATEALVEESVVARITELEKEVTRWKEEAIVWKERFLGGVEALRMLEKKMESVRFQMELHTDGRNGDSFESSGRQGSRADSYGMAVNSSTVRSTPASTSSGFRPTPPNFRPNPPNFGPTPPALVTLPVKTRLETLFALAVDAFNNNKTAPKVNSKASVAITGFFQKQFQTLRDALYDSYEKTTKGDMPRQKICADLFKKALQNAFDSSETQLEIEVFATKSDKDIVNQFHAYLVWAYNQKPPKSTTSSVDLTGDSQEAIGGVETVSNSGTATVGAATVPGTSTAGEGNISAKFDGERGKPQEVAEATKRAVFKWKTEKLKAVDTNRIVANPESVNIVKTFSKRCATSTSIDRDQLEATMPRLAFIATVRNGDGSLLVNESDWKHRKLFKYAFLEYSLASGYIDVYSAWEENLAKNLTKLIATFYLANEKDEVEPLLDALGTLNYYTELQLGFSDACHWKNIHGGKTKLSEGFAIVFWFLMAHITMSNSFAKASVTVGRADNFVGELCSELDFILPSKGEGLATSEKIAHLLSFAFVCKSNIEAGTNLWALKKISIAINWLERQRTQADCNNYFWTDWLLQPSSDYLQQDQLNVLLNTFKYPPFEYPRDCDAPDNTFVSGFTSLSGFNQNKKRGSDGEIPPMQDESGEKPTKSTAPLAPSTSTASKNKSQQSQKRVLDNEENGPAAESAEETPKPSAPSTSTSSKNKSKKPKTTKAAEGVSEGVDAPIAKRRGRPPKGRKTETDKDEQMKDGNNNDDGDEV
ncbi:hypothetical protein HDU76_003803 [Blyttiomyces sp. JEL0837]|nr:hypothetical protein HDU76_003803 [Blyttiomyces sp. JEL0837]